MVQSKIKGRIFRGEFFKSFATTRKKSLAIESAKRLRSRGSLKVRIIKTSTGYTIFTKRRTIKRRPTTSRRIRRR